MPRCLLIVRMRLLLLFLLSSFTLSMQYSEPRNLLASNKETVFIFSTTDTSNTTQDQDNHDAEQETTTTITTTTTATESSQDKATDSVKTEYTETKQSALEDSHNTVLLKEIRDAINKKGDDLEEEFKGNVKDRLNSLSLKLQESVSGVSADLERMRESMDQKVNILLETLSTLKLLVVGQGQHIEELRGRLQGMEEQVKDLQQTTAQTAKPPSNCMAKTTGYDTENEGKPAHGESNPDKENGGKDLSETMNKTTIELLDLKLQVQNISQEVGVVKNTLQDLQANITDLPAVSSTPIPLHTQANATPSAVSCQCSTEALQNAIDKLDETHKQQKTDFLDLKRRVSVIESFRSGMGSYSQRIGIVESPLQELQDMKTTVAAVQGDLNKLKEGMEGALLTPNSTLFDKASGKMERKGMCVWPYTRGGDSCYFVNLEDRLGWEAAREHCRGLQGDLASPPHIPAFRSFMHMQRLSRGYTYWIGASNTNPERAWRWIDGKEVNEEMWEADVLKAARVPRCMAIKPSFRFDAVAAVCHESKFFICEQERLL